MAYGYEGSTKRLPEQKEKEHGVYFVSPLSDTNSNASAGNRTGGSEASKVLSNGTEAALPALLGGIGPSTPALSISLK
jgi:hypothetical protein